MTDFCRACHRPGRAGWLADFGSCGRPECDEEVIRRERHRLEVEESETCSGEWAEWEEEEQEA